MHCISRWLRQHPVHSHMLRSPRIARGYIPILPTLKVPKSHECLACVAFVTYGIVYDFFYQYVWLATQVFCRLAAPPPMAGPTTMPLPSANMVHRVINKLYPELYGCESPSHVTLPTGRLLTRTFRGIASLSSNNMTLETPSVLVPTPRHEARSAPRGKFAQASRIAIYSIFPITHSEKSDLQASRTFEQ
ncbi:hypothetical protein BC629DRAFT_254290 [Irpex lacteus]|nr:hypothetical protein BC629DRAFT_254290 [Irpex lacteus]